MSADEPTDEGTSRREMLKRGAVVGAAVWTVPLVQVVGMSPAHADSLSGAAPPRPPQTPVNVPVPPTEGTPTATISRPATPESGAVDSHTGHRPAEPAATSSTSVGVASAGALAQTGPATPVLPTALAGAAAVVIGAGAVVASRRRSDDLDDQSNPES